ncbi:MAG: AzlC family ABC transporter permease [Acidibrevibacterium sp.]|uniref:AzlC family ABC transporter permease n=1 Tax=Acidibrevibacterium sp. TaxID=2606776 RepID=UPI003CFCA9E8
MTTASFTAAGFARGARRSLALALGLAPFGLIVGVLAAGKGLSLAEIGLMSGLVFAGASQILALDIWAHPAPVLAVSFAAFAVNLRMALMGPALTPWLERLSGWRLWGNLFLLVDHGFALAIAEGRKGERDGGFLFGAGFALWCAWLACSLAGHLLGATLHPPRGHPLFFAALAAFISLLVPLWRGRHDALPWLAAAIVALPVAHFAPRGAWHVVAAALAGGLVGAFRERQRARS